jgi:small-conductance mechanosensitive channel
VITDLVSQFTEATGLYETTFFWVSVEDWINLAISIILALIVGFLLSRLVFYALKKAVAKTETQYDDAFIKVIRHQISLIFIVVGFQIGVLRLPFIDVTIKQVLNQFFIAIYVIAATIIVWRLLDVLVEWYQNDVEPKREPHQTDTLLLLMHRLARTLLVTISLILLLSLYNINVNALIAALGIGGLAISLGAQDTLSNIISGVMIMLDQPFRVGDRIEIQGLGTWGDVVDIGLRSTRIRTRDNRLVIVPNNSISTDQIVNYTYPDTQYRIQIEIGVGYGQDIEKVRQIIIDTVRQVAGVLPDKPVDALYVEMGQSAMTFRVRWWIDSYVDTRRMFDSVNTALQKTLDEAGVEMPFNTYDINIMNMPGTTEENNQDGENN